MRKLIAVAFTTAALVLGAYASQEKMTSKDAKIEETTPAISESRKRHGMGKEDLSERCKKSLEEAKALVEGSANRDSVLYHIELAAVNAAHIATADQPRRANMYARRCLREASDAKRVARLPAFHTDAKKPEASKEGKEDPKKDIKKDEKTEDKN